MALALLEKVKQKALGAIQYVGNYFNPQSNGGNNFWSSPIANTAVNAQNSIQSSVQSYLQKLNEAKQKQDLFNQQFKENLNPFSKTNQQAYNTAGKALELTGQTIQPKIVLPEALKYTPLDILASGADLPGAVLESYGKTAQLFSKPEGRQSYKEGVKKLLTTKPELTSKYVTNTLENPATSATLDALDLLPGGLLFGGVKSLGKEGIKKITPELAQKFLKLVEKDGTEALVKRYGQETVDRYIKTATEALNVPQVEKKGLESIKSTIENLSPSEVGKTLHAPIKIVNNTKLSPEELIKSNINAEKIAQDVGTKIPNKRLTQLERKSQVNIAKDKEEIQKSIDEINGILERTGIKTKDVPEVTKSIKKTTESLMADKVVKDKSSLKKTLQELEVGRQNTFDYIDKKTEEILSRNGLGPENLRAVMEGKLQVNPDDLALLREIDNQILKISGGEVSLENHFPHISNDMMDKITINSSYGGKLASQSFDFNLARENKIPEEKLINNATALKQSYDTALSKKYGDALEASNIIKENNIPEEKADEVFNFVKEESAKADELNKEHLEKTNFGKSVDYVEKAREYQEKLAKITGNVVERLVVPDTANFLDNFVDKLRIDDTFFQQRTNPEIWQAFQDLRNASYLTSESNFKQSRKVALANFIDVATRYDYASKTVKQVINNFIDSELKAGKVVQSTGSKFLRLLSNIFTGAHIGGNVKTVITQPTEIFRITAEEGPQHLKPAIETLAKDSKRIIDSYGLNGINAQLLAENPVWKETSDKLTLLDKAGKGSDQVLKYTMAGMKYSEELKNMVLASMAEQKGLSKGLQIGTKEMTNFVVDEIFRVGHIGAKFSTPMFMKNNALMSGLFQYSQYSLKNAVLKYDTLMNVADEKRLYKLGAQIMADTLATLTVAGVTGVGVKNIYELFKNSSLPNGFGPLVTVPYEYATEYFDTLNKSNDPNVNPEDVPSLSDVWLDTSVRNFAPTGNQILKSKGGIDTLNKGYSESAKGNINYPVGDLNVLQKIQTVLFGKGAIPNKKEADKIWSARDAGKSDVYPTLTAKQSAIFKTLPRDQQELYYDQQIAKQSVSEKSIINSLEKPQKKGLFSKKEPISNDDKIKEFYFPQGDATSKDVGTRKKAFQAVEKVMSDETLPDSLKEKVMQQSGASPEDIAYYHVASTTPEERTQKFLDIAQTSSHDELIFALATNKRQVAGYSITNSDTIDYLYDQGYISKADKKYLTALKWDPIYNKFYMNKDYTGGGITDSQRKSYISKLNSLFKVGTGTTSFKPTKLKTLEIPKNKITKKVNLNKLKITSTKKQGQWFTG